MRLYGLTGGIGMGKSTADTLLRKRGVDVVDTDLIARQVVEPGRPALAEVAQAFGDEVIDPEGRLRRDELARLVFANPSARKQLEDILHPRIRKLWKAQVREWREAGRPLAVVVVPLLFETNAGPEFDATICVACSGTSQLERLVARGWSAGQARQRIEAQWPVERKMVAANYVVWTEGLLSVHAAQLERILFGAAAGM